MRTRRDSLKVSAGGLLLAGIPEVDAGQWKSATADEPLEKRLELTYQNLTRDFETVEVAAVCICSGNWPGLSQPHLPNCRYNMAS